jgi:Na+-translocating ferredoxin:NAD+ oxidoreductase RnfD subunit
VATMIAVVSAVATESCILYLKNKKLTFTGSSLISGLIIGYVLSSDNPWWKIALTSVIAIGSKYFIRINKKHLFNPAALGIFLITIFLGAYTQWKGTYDWFVLLPCGLYFAYKMKKIEIIINYVLISLVLFGIQAWMQKISLWHTLGYFSYFFIFIMLIEPKTTPIKQLGKLIFGLGAAALIFALTDFGAGFDVELCALLVLNLFVPLLNKIPQRRSI